MQDRLVSGTRKDRVQQRLLAEPKLTFNKVHKIAIAMEFAEKNSQVLRDGQTSEEDNKLTVDKLAGEWKGRECFRCGGNHVQTNGSWLMQCVSVVRREGT